MDRRHGTERALSELLERLARHYHCEVHLYAQRAEGIALTRERPAGAPESGAILWHKVPSVPGPHLLRFVCWIVLNSFRRAWDRHMRRLQFDLVLSPGINCLDADLVLVHALFHRLLELVREVPAQGSRLGFFRRLHRRVYYALLTRLERRVYTNPKVALAAVSRRTAALLSQYFRRQDVRIIPNAVDTSYFCPSARLALRPGSRQRCGFKEQDFVLLLIGNDWLVKGLETALRTISALKDLPFRILIVGDESPEPFRKLATKLGVLDRCCFELPREDVLDLYAAADVYVSPSLEDSFGLPVAEAMACGLPAITSSFAGVAELIESGVDGFVLRDPQDFRELAALLNQLFRSPDRVHRVGEAAARKAVEWTWDRNAAALWEFLNEVCAQKPRPPQ